MGIVEEIKDIFMGMIMFRYKTIKVEDCEKHVIYDAFVEELIEVNGRTLFDSLEELKEEVEWELQHQEEKTKRILSLIE